MGPTRRARCVPRATLRAAGPVRGRDRIAARRVDGARAARHRPPSTSRLRPSRGAVAGDRARSARPARSRPGESASLPVAPRRLLRPPQLPQPYWKPAQIAMGIVPLRRVYDLRHTFATFALRAGISTFDLSRYMG